jgi:hypothetical protein
VSFGVRKIIMNIFFEDDDQKKDFDMFGNLSKAWEVNGNELLRCAKIIENKDREDQESDPYRTMISGSILMLFGLAIECYLKGIYVKQGNKLAENGKLVKIPETNMHDLLGIANKVNISFSKAEKDILNHLKKNVLYAGRYPIPKNYTQNKSKYSKGGIPLIDRIIGLPDELELIYKIITRLQNMLSENNV